MKNMFNWAIGKKNRLKRFIDSDTGAILAVPMDHGYSIGISKGLKDLNATVQNVVKGGATSVIMQRGMVRSIDMPMNTGLMVHVSGSTGLSSLPNYKILTGSVIDTIRLGADGISCHINIGPDQDYAMLRDFSMLSEETDEYGLPLLAMTYVRDNNGIDDKSPDALSHAARIAEESGADIVKIHMTEQAKSFDEVTQGINIPIVVAGGSKSDNFRDFLESIKKAILSGASGISVGRNIFAADDQVLAMSKIKEVVKDAVKEGGRVEIFH